MNCIAAPVRFRLLDGNVGWEPVSATSSPDVLFDIYGLRLNNRQEPKLDNRAVSSFLPPASLAIDCAHSQWYACGVEDLVNEQRPILVHFDGCHTCLQDIRPRLSRGHLLHRPLAVAATGQRLAVIDRSATGQHRVWVWSMPDGRLAGYIELAPQDIPHAIAFSAWQELLVSIQRSAVTLPAKHWLLRLDLAGRYRGKIDIPGASQPLVRLRPARDGALWGAAGPLAGPFDLWRVRLSGQSTNCECESESVFSVQQMNDAAFYQIAAESLNRAIQPTALVSVEQSSFGINERGLLDAQSELCFGWDGVRCSAPRVRNTNRATSQTGEFLTAPLDSFIPRCQWHRVRVDAELPENTSYTIEVATNEKPETPHELDWQSPIENATDFLIDQPPGKYLFVRIRLKGIAGLTPVLRRIRIDFPRVTSLNELPTVYREDPEAEDFTERFLSLFDAATEDLDRAIERFPAMLDPIGVPEEVLPWLGSLLGMVFDSDSPAEQRRALLLAAPELYRKRGTLAGLKLAIELIFGSKWIAGTKPVIQEQAFRRAWGVVKHSARLGSVRLFGKSESRFRVGRSGLGSAPLRSYGNPEHDPVRADAHQFVVLMPPSPELTQLGMQRLNQLIENQKPAHTKHTVRVGGQGFIVGHRSVIGIDTQFVAPPPVVLQAAGNSSAALRLGESVLRPGPNRPTSSLHLGDSSTIGIQTLLE